MNKSLLFVSGVLAGICLMVGYHYGLSFYSEPELTKARRALSHEEMLNTQMHDENVALNDEIDVLRLQLKAGHSLAANASAAPALDSAAGSFVPLSPMTQMEALLQNPKTRDLIAAEQRRLMEATYADLIKSFDLNAEEHAHFINLLVNKQFAQMDLGSALMSADLDPEARAALTKKLQDSMIVADDKIQEFLNNDEDFAAYKNYSDQQPERVQLQSLDSSLAGAGQPLSTDQKTALLNAMYKERKNFDFPVANGAAADTPVSEQILQQQERLQAQIEVRAAQILTPAQLKVFQAGQAASRQSMRAGTQMVAPAPASPAN